MAYSAIRLLFVGKSIALERECQRHLYLPWGADGMGHITEAGRAVIEAAVSLFAFGVASGGQSGLAHGWELVEILILKNLVAGDVKAGGVGKVVHVEGVLQVEAFGDAGHFYQRDIRPLLGCLAEDIALTSGEVGLDGISCWNRGRQRAGWGNQGDRKALWIEGREIVDSESP
jgi:hypothetical protein